MNSFTINIASPEIYNNCNGYSGYSIIDPIWGSSIPFTTTLSGGNFTQSFAALYPISAFPPPPLSASPCPCKNTFYYNEGTLNGPFQIFFSPTNLTDQVFDILKITYNFDNGTPPITIVKNWITNSNVKSTIPSSIYYPTSSYSTTYNPYIIVERSNNCIDIHQISFNITQTSVLNYSNLSVVNTQVVDQSGDVIYTLQSDSPNSLYSVKISPN